MIVIGDPGVLMYDPNWLELLHYARDNKACCGSPMPELPPLPSSTGRPTGPLQVPGGGVSAAGEASWSMGDGGSALQSAGPSSHQLLDRALDLSFGDAEGDSLAQEMQAMSLQQAFSAIGAVEGVATTRHDA